MRQILFVDGCVREDQSSTKKISDVFLQEYLRLYPQARLSQVNLNQLSLQPLNAKTLEIRNQRITNPQDSLFSLARQFQQSDLVVLAAPFWNGSFPASMHTYLEHICVPEITFLCENDVYQGLCKAKACILITTRGGRYENGVSMLGEEHATPLLKSIMSMLGINEVITLAAEGLDLPGAKTGQIMQNAFEQAARLAKRLG